jgi:glutamate racemase
MKIGVFDSGVGGLSVVKSLLEHHLFKEIVYYGDTARTPYGNKDQNTIISYSLEALEFFKNFNIDLMIIACNTASVYALETLKKQASFPVVGVVEAGILALENAQINKNDYSLIIATTATIKSNAYAYALEKKGYSNIESKATGLFVPVVEDGIYEGAIIDTLMDHYFSNIKQPKHIVLACTHFPLLSNALKKYFGNNIKLIHSGEAIVEYLEKKYTFKKKFKNTKLTLFASQNPDKLKETAKIWLNKS